jgi:hypothetical protein
MFNKMAEQHGEDTGLALWHEVAILPEGHLDVQYMNFIVQQGFYLTLLRDGSEFGYTV